MHVRIEPRGYDHPDVVPLVAAVQREYVRRYGGEDTDPTDSAAFQPPDGLFLVGYLGERAVVIGGFRRFDASTAEIKRMYVHDAVRRHGLARQMLGELETAASRAGFRRIVLNTGSQQPEAIALYESAGYRPTDSFGYWCGGDGARFFGKDL